MTHHRNGPSYAAILFMIEKLYRDIRRLEVAVGSYIKDCSGETWEQIGDVVGISDEGARKRYTKVDGDDGRPRRGKPKG